jgi:hypothetical protein
MILKELCPACGTRLEMRKACCADRDKGWLVVKRCPKGDYSARWDPQSLFGGKK